MRSILAIDTGGTKTRIVEFATPKSPTEIALAEVLAETEFPTPRDTSEYLDVVTTQIQQNFPNFRKFSEENVVVLATRGQIKNGVLTSTLLGWQDFPIAEQLSRRLSNVKVLSGNDSKIGTLGAFLESETKRGLYVTIGTGINGGLIVDGELSTDTNAMEIGKITFMENGQSFTWESIASGAAFFAKYKRFGDEIPTDDPIWSEYAKNIAKGIVVILPILQPDEIIVGGAMAEFFPKYGEIMRKLVKNNAWAPVAQVKISAAKDPRYTVNRGALIFALKTLGE